VTRTRYHPASMRRWLPLLASMALLAACSADRTAILVEVTSPDLAVPADVDGLRFTAVSEYGGRVDQSFPISGQWPHSLTIVPPEGERMGAITITVTGLHGGDVVVRRVVTSAFMQGVTRPVTVSLPADCRGVLCADGVDCLGGMCVGEGPDAGTPDAGDDDGGTIEGDAGPEGDGGAFDAGMVDAGPIDAGMRDAGRDAGMPDAGGAFRCIDAACVGRIVISEVAPRGGGTASDEFVELYNRSAGPVDVGGVELRYFSSTGAESGRGVIAADTVIPSHGYLLLVSSGYAGAVAGDPVMTPWTTGIADSGTVGIRAGTMFVDRVGWGTATVAEGTPFATAPPAGGSYERRANATSSAASMSAGGADATAGNGHDTDMNAVDFVARATRDPQSSASGTEP
jgi:hypothetical protein